MALGTDIHQPFDFVPPNFGQFQQGIYFVGCPLLDRQRGIIGNNFESEPLCDTLGNSSTESPDSTWPSVAWPFLGLEVVGSSLLDLVGEFAM